MGVVRQDVNKSAGREGCIGSTSLGPQAASCIQFCSRPTQLVTAVFCREQGDTLATLLILYIYLKKELAVPLSSK